MAADEPDFKKLLFKSPETTDRNWLDWFREEYSQRLYRLDVELKPDTPFKIDATTRMLPDLAISQSVRSPMRTLHRGDVNDDISMQFLLEGNLSVQVEGETHELTTGMGGIGRHGTKCSVDIPAGARLLSIRLRRRLLEPLIKVSDLHGFAVLNDTLAMRLLLGYLRMLDAEDTIATPDARHLVTQHVHDLVALALGATRDAQGLIEERGERAGRLAAIKADIFDNLSRPELSVTSVAARQGVSPRYVQLLFEAEGTTFSVFLLEQRLMRAHRMLSDPRLMAQTISAIALHVGFNDVSYFNRTFRRRFGMTPSDVRAAALGERD